MRRANGKPAILVVGQGATHTGYSRVLHSVLAHLHQRYEIHHFALGYDKKSEETRWQIYANQSPGDKLGVEQLRPLVQRIRPKLVLLLEDIWLFPFHLKILAEFRNRLRVILYCPIEDNALPPTIVESINTADRVFVFNKCGQAVLEKTIEEIRREHPEFWFPLIGIIPHGVDVSQFYPLARSFAAFDGRASRALARRLLFGGEAEDPDGFIVLNANRHRPRKRLDITVQGFSAFASGKPKNVKLYLHTGVDEIKPNLVYIAKQYGIAERLLPVDPLQDHPCVSDQRLNLLYNACDVGINTGKSEAWGLVSFEHAATGAAQIVPGHGVYKELWEGAAIMLETVGYGNKRDDLIERHVTPEGVADALEELYRDRNLLQRLSTAAYARATRREYAWSSIAERWDQVFSSLIEEGWRLGLERMP